MYGFLLRPDTLPRSYNVWYARYVAMSIYISPIPLVLNRIDQASKVPSPAIKINRDLVRDGTFSMSDLDALVGHKA
jgi:hypothetical protein